MSINTHLELSGRRILVRVLGSKISLLESGYTTEYVNDATTFLFKDEEEAKLNFDGIITQARAIESTKIKSDNEDSKIVAILNYDYLLGKGDAGRRRKPTFIKPKPKVEVEPPKTTRQYLANVVEESPKSDKEKYGKDGNVPVPNHHVSANKKRGKKKKE